MTRLLIDTLVALMLAAVLAGIVLSDRNEQTEEQQALETRNSVAQISRQIKLQTALGHTDVNERGFALNVESEWFGGALPDNPLVGDGHPWMEIAGVSQKDMVHPPDRVAVNSATAKFWYNPANGIVRARVPMSLSDERGLAMYNTVNGCQLSSLFE